MPFLFLCCDYHRASRSRAHREFERNLTPPRTKFSYFIFIVMSSEKEIIKRKGNIVCFS